MPVTHFTPGPWSVGYTREVCPPRTPRRFEAAIHVGESANRGNALALVGLGGAGAIDSSRKAVEANAHLIAAAPEMYVMLERLAEYIPDRSSLQPELQSILAKARGNPS